MDLMNMTCSQAIDVKFRDLSYVVQVGYRGPKKQILNNLNGLFRSTELTAIMGPSGAGKSTLLNILSGFQRDMYTGTIEYLSRNCKQDQKSYKKQLCYIQQDDNLHDFFTVHEIMMIASYLKINRSVSRKFRQTLVDDILNALKLSHTKEIRVNRLSGGERKRLSIALELINNYSPVIFLDEPTTGLDSSASIQCITTLKTLAQTGRTIICTIHQPSSVLYKMFDHIYLIVDGLCLYRAPPDNTIDYFARQGLQCPMYHNPADYMLEVASKEYGDYSEQLIAAAKTFAETNRKRTYEMHSIKSPCDTILKTPDNQTMLLTKPPTELTRFWVLLQCFAILSHRDFSILYIKLIMHTVIATVAGLLFVHAGDEASLTMNNILYLLTTSIYLYYASLMPAVIKFPLKIDILRKELFNNWYQLKTYYLGMLVHAIPLQVIFAFIYSSISYFLSDQPFENFRFCKFLLIAILTNFVSESIGLVLGATLNPVNGTFLGAIIIGVMLCLNGAVALFKHMSSFIYYFSYLNMMRYTFNGLLQSLYYNREKLHCSQIYCYWGTPSMILQELNMTKSQFWLDVAVLFGYFVLLHVLAYMLLKRRLSRIY